MVAREPGETEAAYERRKRDIGHGRVREVKGSSSEEEEERDRAAGPAAGPSPGAAGSAAPTLIVGEEEEEEKEEEKEEKDKEKSPETENPKETESPKEPKETKPIEEKDKEQKSPPKKGPPKRREEKKRSKAPRREQPEEEKKEEALRPKGDFIEVATGRAQSSGGTRGPAVVLRGAIQQTYEVRSLRGRSETRQGTWSGERLVFEPNEPPARRGPSESAPWRRSQTPASSAAEVKRSHGKGFRLRSSQSRQYRNLRAQLRQNRKFGIKVPSELKNQVEDFGEGRTETFKRGKNPAPYLGGTRKRRRERSESSRPGIRLRSVKPGIRLVSVARAPPANPKKQPVRPFRPPAGLATGSNPAAKGRTVHGRALKLHEKIRTLANQWASENLCTDYALGSPFQVRTFAGRQLVKEKNLIGTIADQLVKNLWNLPNEGSKEKGPDQACSSCDEREDKQKESITKFLAAKRAKTQSK